MASAVAALKDSRPVRAALAVPGAFDRLHLGDQSAALTYYAILAVFPGIIVLVALVGVFGEDSTVDGVLRIIEDVAPGSADETFEDVAQGAIEGGGAGYALVIGLLVSVYSASGYIRAFNRAANSIHEVEETRPFWKNLPRQVALTFFLLLVLAIALLTLLLTGPVAEAIGTEIGIGDTALTLWSILKWPALAGVIVILFGVLLFEGPNVEHRRFRSLLPGSALAMVLWLAASAGFAVYLANFGSYANTYGSLAGVIVFLIWLWISNLALLVGATYNVELAKAAAPAGEPAPSRS